MNTGNRTDAECFYIDTVDAGRVALLLGPYRTLEAAQSDLDALRGRIVDECCKRDAKAWFYAYGTSKWKTGHRDGMLNETFSPGRWDGNAIAQRKRKEQANALALENVRAHLIYRQRIQRGAF